jgi:7-cyano-7-deazaguanine synthase
MQSEKHALVVLSGGQDSTTCLALAMQNYGVNRVHAITFDYGQRHKVEIDAAARIAALAGLAARHELVTVAGLLHGTSPLVNPAARVETYESAEKLPGGLEKTFVPMRNQLFLTLAANRAVVIGIDVGCDVDIITGVSQEDYGGYPDCRIDFIESLENSVGLSLDDEALPHIRILAPLMSRNKRETVELAQRTSGAMALLAFSHTCYNGSVPPCGKCHACLLRERGFKAAGVDDPLLARLKADAEGDSAFISAMLDSIPRPYGVKAFGK